MVVGMATNFLAIDGSHVVTPKTAFGGYRELKTKYIETLGWRNIIE